MLKLEEKLLLENLLQKSHFEISTSKDGQSLVQIKRYVDMSTKKEKY